MSTIGTVAAVIATVTLLDKVFGKKKEDSDETGEAPDYFDRRERPQDEARRRWVDEE